MVALDVHQHRGQRFAGRYAIALVLDGVVLCIVPVGVQGMRSSEAA